MSAKLGPRDVELELGETMSARLNRSPAGPAGATGAPTGGAAGVAAAGAGWITKCRGQVGRTERVASEEDGGERFGCCEAATHALAKHPKLLVGETAVSEIECSNRVVLEQ